MLTQSEADLLTRAYEMISALNNLSDTRSEYQRGATEYSTWQAVEDSVHSTIEDLETAMRVANYHSPGAGRTAIVKFTGAKRYGTSRNGNPTWNIYTADDGSYRTQSDGSIGYQMANYSGGPNSLVGRLVLLRMTAAGRVWDMTAL